MKLYGEGLLALQGHDYKAAHNAFSQVLKGFSDERDVAERASLYLKVCQRHLAGNPRPKTLSAQELLARATFALNAGQFSDAIGQARAVLHLDEGNDHAHYVLALAHALDGNSSVAVRHLSRSIDLNPACRSIALAESDFESLRSDPAFRALVEAAPEGPRRRTRQK